MYPIRPVSLQLCDRLSNRHKSLTRQYDRLRLSDFLWLYLSSFPQKICNFINEKTLKVQVSSQFIRLQSSGWAHITIICTWKDSSCPSACVVVDPDVLCRWTGPVPVMQMNRPDLLWTAWRFPLTQAILKSLLRADRLPAGCVSAPEDVRLLLGCSQWPPGAARCRCQKSGCAERKQRLVNAPLCKSVCFFLNLVPGSNYFWQ